MQIDFWIKDEDKTSLSQGQDEEMFRKGSEDDGGQRIERIWE